MFLGRSLGAAQPPLRLTFSPRMFGPPLLRVLRGPSLYRLLIPYPFLCLKVAVCVAEDLVHVKPAYDELRNEDTATFCQTTIL